MVQLVQGLIIIHNLSLYLPHLRGIKCNQLILLTKQVFTMQPEITDHPLLQFITKNKSRFILT